MSLFSDIRAALEEQVSNISGAPSSLSWENVDFDATAGQSHLRLELVPISSEPAVRGYSPQELHRGRFSIGVFTPENEGPNAADVLADAVRDAFAPTTDLTKNSTTVRIRTASRGQGVLISPFYFVPVEVSWYTYS